MTSVKRIPAVSLIRVIAMLSIVGGHLCTWKGIYTYQLGAIGVEIFLFISGYLYGNRVIKERKKWLLARGKRILIPYWILAIFLVICMIVYGRWGDGIKQLLCAAFNLQGWNYLLPEVGVELHYIGGIGHCWFVTMIMICYGLTVLVKESRLERYIDKHYGMSLLIAVVVQIIFAMNGVQLSYILQYFIGYFYCRYEKGVEKKKEAKLYAVVTILMIAMMILRLIANRFVDGTVFYNHVIARLSFNVLGAWLYGVGVWLSRRFEKGLNNITESVLWKKLDSLSYPIFLVHYMFLMEPFDLKLFIPITVWQIVGALGLTIVSAILLQLLEKRVNSLTAKIAQWERLKRSVDLD